VGREHAVIASEMTARWYRVRQHPRAMAYGITVFSRRSSEQTSYGSSPALAGGLSSPHGWWGPGESRSSPWARACRG
jgi:hypothetical protein